MLCLFFATTLLTLLFPVCLIRALIKIWAKRQGGHLVDTMGSQYTPSTDPAEAPEALIIDI